MEGFGDFHHTDIEIGGVDDLNGLVGGVGIFCAVVGLDMIVESLGGEFCMQFPGFAIHTGTVVIVDPVGHVGGLLYLGQHDTATDGMGTACREIEHIA